MIIFYHLLDVTKCYETIRNMRWQWGVCCPHCSSNKIVGRGKNHRQQECKRYRCKKCGKQFDDLTGTIFAKKYKNGDIH